MGQRRDSLAAHIPPDSGTGGVPRPGARSPNPCSFREATSSSAPRASRRRRGLGRRLERASPETRRGRLRALARDARPARDPLGIPIGPSDIGQHVEDRRPRERLLLLSPKGRPAVEQLTAVAAELGVVPARDLDPLRVRRKQPPVREHPVRRRDAVVRGEDLGNRKAQGRQVAVLRMGGGDQHQRGEVRGVGACDPGRQGRSERVPRDHPTRHLGMGRDRLTRPLFGEALVRLEGGETIRQPDDEDRESLSSDGPQQRRVRLGRDAGTAEEDQTRPTGRRGGKERQAGRVAQNRNVAIASQHFLVDTASAHRVGQPRHRERRPQHEPHADPAAEGPAPSSGPVGRFRHGSEDDSQRTAS